MKRKAGLLVLFFLIMIGFVSCSENSPFSFLTPKKPAKVASPITTSTTTSGPTSSGEVMSIKGPLLAEVNNWRIGVDDFENRLSVLKESGMYKDVKLDTPESKKQILDELIRLVILSQEAEKRGIGNLPDVKEAVADYRRTLLVQKLGEDIGKDSDVTEDEIKNFYNTKKADYFTEPPQYRLREIAVATDAVAKDLYIKILQGEDIAGLATQNSLLPTKDKGGDTGLLVPSLENRGQKYWEAVATLEAKGDISKVFKGDDGKFYIIRLEEKQESRVKSLDDVRPQIREYLKADKQKQKADGIVNTAKQNSKITIKEDLLH